MPSSWTNWGRNQRFTPAAIFRPLTEDDAIARIGEALRAGQRVRVAGSGHSFTPVVETDGLLVDLSALTGVISVDAAQRQAVVRAGSTIASLGEPLWNAGLSIANQGDVDVQSIAGAVATGTKGSGLAFGSLSSAVTSMRLIDGRGEVVDIDASDPEALAAAQVSVGMLGVALRIGLQLVPAYGLREENCALPMAEVFERWDDLLRDYRHFSFWWMPTDRSAAMYALGDVPADHCFVKLLREVPPEAIPARPGPLNARTDRAYRIYPDGTTDAEFHELEYMVPASRAREAVLALQSLMLTRFPHEISPLQVRWQKGDSAFLSAQSGRDSVSLSVSGVIGEAYEPFLRAVDTLLAEFDARPHWGKLHFLTPESFRRAYPDAARFEAVRRRFDPEDRFLNSHLKALLA
ncbi:D-arabinono-1,4-lactone oxidase [Pararhodobacter sp. CCB-MM2]|uniref:D-arabinono-1,4-lactone oxidase n=1 Tax=Pararhodobacter sp. CCB-MM2 TaxID=1786003 RepID=UPI000833E238|nr:D-arabinono-1,4-lactone oxidase [Pararhodobacter sp. CCB-MM2]